MRLMRIRDFRDLTNVCRRADIDLDPELEMAARQYDVDDICYTPTQWMGVIARAGAVLRTEPGTSLASKPIPVDAHPADNFSARVVTRIINASLGETPENNQLYPAFAGHDQTLNTCPAADINFGFAVRALQGEYDMQTQIVSHGDRALFLRKGGVGSALALSAVSIGGIPYPAGSLARLHIKSETTRIGAQPGSLRYVTRLHHNSLPVVPASDVVSASFLRLSAYALPLDERADFTAGILKSTPQPVLDIMHTMNIEQMRQLADVALLQQT